jgi:orotidine-5'-phosphate decarboxylase
MSERNWNELLAAQQAKGLFVCVGLDIAEGKIPSHFMPSSQRGEHLGRWPRQLEYAKEIVRATVETGLVGCFKPNLAFWKGDQGKRDLQLLIEFIHELAPEIPVILDAKWGDIGNTNDGYVDELASYYGFDAVTIHNYMGLEAMQPFLDDGNKGAIVLCRTSNPGSDEFQCRQVGVTKDEAEILGFSKALEAYERGAYGLTTVPMYQYVAGRVSRYWNSNGNCALVVGATYADVELKIVREIIGDMPILLPGIGAQGGDLEKTVANGHNSQGQGMIINSSRGIVFASKEKDFAERAAEETVKLHKGITNALVV